MVYDFSRHIVALAALVQCAYAMISKLAYNGYCAYLQKESHIMAPTPLIFLLPSTKFYFPVLAEHCHRLQFYYICYIVCPSV